MAYLVRYTDTCTPGGICRNCHRDRAAVIPAMIITIAVPVFVGFIVETLRLEITVFQERPAGEVN